MNGRSVDALIVGAGPVGLTMAAALTRHGLVCRIVDKAPAPTDKSKALVVWCRTLELLDQLDLARTFVEAGHPISGGSMYADGQRLVHLALTSGDSPYGFPLMIPQSETERLLAEHLARRGVTVERQVELTSLDAGPDGVACALRHLDGREESCRAPWLIGCDGAHSAVRHALGIPFTGEAEPNDWMLADVHVEGPLAADEVSIFWHASGVLAFFPITRDRFRMIADIGVSTDGANRPDPTLADAQARADERGPGGLTLTHPVWLANFRINERKVQDYRRGRVMLAGDAAHIHSPAGGQGMNTGMQDAFNLGWKLALVQRGLGQAEPLLQSYSAERSAVGDQVLQNAARFTTLATLKSPAAQWMRNHLAPIAGSFQFVRDRIRDEWLELSINYRHSPLSTEHWPARAGGPAAGDRLPDAPLTAPDGRQTTLFAAIRGGRSTVPSPPRHALLLLPGVGDAGRTSALLDVAAGASRNFPDAVSAHLIAPAGAAAPRADTSALARWVDADGRAHRTLGATNRALLLVRPDGYVGYRGQPADSDALAAHMDRYLVRAR